jgi:L-lactate dehydrogenase complex protein LldE
VRVALFPTCLADQVFPGVAASAARLLARLGCEVEERPVPACCGQPAWNAGHAAEARAVAARWLDAFEGAERVVAPSGSCAGMVRHHFAEVFEDDPVLAGRAAALAERTYELSQFVVRVLGRTDVGGAFPHRVAWHPSCHATRLLGVRDEPLALLAAIRGLTLVPLDRAEDCCGFGGTFSADLPDVSAAMADEKCDAVEATGVEFLVSGDAGCLMALAGRMSRRGSNVKTLHLAELLDRATA